MYQKKVQKNSESWNFYEGVKIITKGLESFGERYADLAETPSAWRLRSQLADIDVNPSETGMIDLWMTMTFFPIEANILFLATDLTEIQE